MKMDTTSAQSRRAVIKCLIGLALVLGTACQEELIPKSYQKHLRPTPEGGGPVEVGVGWHVSRIHHVSVDEMYLEISLRPTISWQDKRIQYSGDDHVGEHADLLPLNLDYLDYAWKPDLFFLDTREVTRFSMVDQVAGLWLMRNLTFYLSFLTKIKLDCPMHYRSYPFDSQKCQLTLVSYEYNKRELVLYWVPHGVTYSHILGEQLPGYHVTFLPGNVTDHPWCEDCFLEPAAALTASIVLDRRYEAYLLTVYVPSALFVAVAWVSFFWPPEPVPGRTVLVITSLLTVVSMFAAVRQSSPHTNYAKATDVWFFVCICFNLTVLFEFACVIWIRRQRGKLTNPIISPMGDFKNSQPPSSKPSTRALVRNHSSVLLTNLQVREERLESVSRIIYPLMFLLFNLVYWPVYLT